MAGFCSVYTMVVKSMDGVSRRQMGDAMHAVLLVAGYVGGQVGPMLWASSDTCGAVWAIRAVDIVGKSGARLCRGSDGD